VLKFMGGALLGAAVALVMAPISGEELRDEVSNQIDDGMEQGKAMARKVSRRAREIRGRAQEQLRRTSGAAPTEISEATEL
jgi:gas vesicle protein